jgi:mannitol/fructose-specific phosphotransferase system IIA component (Ntr-type)
MRLFDFIIPELITLNMKAATKDEAIQEIVETLAAAGVLESDGIDSAIKHVRDREDMMATGCGRGIGFPEVIHPLMRRTCAAIFFARGGIDWQALDDQNVDLLVAFAKVPDRPREFLDMACLWSRALRNDHFANQLRQAKTREEVIAVVEGETHDISPD